MTAVSFDALLERGAGVVRPPASPVLRPGLIEAGLVSTPARVRLRAFVTPAAPRPAPPLRRSANRKEGPPSCCARSRHSICPGPSTPALTSTSRVRTTVDRRPLIREGVLLDTSSRDGIPECRSTRIGQADSLARPRLGEPAGDCALRAARARAKLEIVPGRGRVTPSGLSCQPPNIGGAEKPACFSSPHALRGTRLKFSA